MDWSNDPDAAPLRRDRTGQREQISRQREPCLRLEAIRDHLEAAENGSAEENLQALERMTMIENY